MSAQPGSGQSEKPASVMDDEPAGTGWLLFALILIGIAGCLNVIWGIAAISESKFFVADAKFILTDLKTWGWIVLLIGVVQIGAAFSILAGGQLGRWLGTAAAAVNSIGALMSIPAYPLWALCLFAIDILIIYGLAAYGGQHRPIG